MKLNRYNKIIIINISPKSIEACLKLGIDTKQLYYYDFITFKNNNPDIRTLAQDIQKLRWEHFNRLREQTVFRAQEVIYSNKLGKKKYNERRIK
jgi:hypothetical protein